MKLIWCIALGFSLYNSGMAAFRDNQFNYIDQVSDRGSGLILLGGYRIYNTNIGQFLKQDNYTAFQSKRTKNGFNYTSGNPILLADTSGHQEEAHLSLITSEWSRREDDVEPEKRLIQPETRPIISLYTALYPDEVLAKKRLEDAVSNWNTEINSFHQDVGERTLSQLDSLARKQNQLALHYKHALDSTDPDFIHTTRVAFEQELTEPLKLIRKQVDELYKMGLERQTQFVLNHTYHKLEEFQAQQAEYEAIEAYQVARTMKIISL